MTTHYVKSWPALFDAILSGEKTHDLRKRSDRDYQVNDIMCLREYDPITHEYTGRGYV